MTISAIISSSAASMPAAASLTPASASPVTSRVMAIALEVLNEIRAMNIKTLHSIVPCAEYNTKRNPLEHYTQFGKRYFEIVDHAYDLEIAREGIDDYLAQDGLTESIPQSMAVMAEIAMARQMKVSACGEVSRIAFVLAGTKGLQSCWVALQGEDGEFDNHGIVIVGEEASCEVLCRRISDVQKMKLPLLDQLARLTRTVILDPYLDIAFPAEGVRESEKFVQSLQAMRVDTLSEVGTFNVPLRVYENIWTKALAMRPELKKRTERISAEESEKVEKRGLMFTFIQEVRKRELITILETKFPATQGKWKEGKGLLYVNLEEEGTYKSLRDTLTGIEKLQSGSFMDKEGKKCHSIRIPVATYDKVRKAYEVGKRLRS